MPVCASGAVDAVVFANHLTRSWHRAVCSGLVDQTLWQRQPRNFVLTVDVQTGAALEGS